MGPILQYNMRWVHHPVTQSSKVLTARRRGLLDAVIGNPNYPPKPLCVGLQAPKNDSEISDPTLANIENEYKGDPRNIDKVKEEIAAFWRNDDCEFEDSEEDVNEHPQWIGRLPPADEFKIENLYITKCLERHKKRAIE